jgi:Lrp/AsnC family leucine-responsive transcriptional regulator
VKRGRPVDTKISPIQATILKHLLVDGRKSCTKIAKECSVAKEVIYENYKELKQAGIIKGATIHINYGGFGYKAVVSLLIITDPAQADNLIQFVHKMPDIYSVYKTGPGGNIRVIATLKTLQQLDEIKDSIKQKFPISEIKTGIWTGVKEMHENLNLASNGSIINSNISLQTKSATPVSSNNRSQEIDEIDLQITQLLAANGREPLSKIAQQIGISTNAVIKRYKNLKKYGLIKATIQIDPAKIGYRAVVIFFAAFTIQADPLSIIERISRIPDIISIMKTSGDYDLQIYAMIKNIEQLLTIQEEFTKIPGIAKMELDIFRTLKIWPTPRQYISTF